MAKKWKPYLPEREMGFLLSVLLKITIRKRSLIRIHLSKYIFESISRSLLFLEIYLKNIGKKSQMSYEKRCIKLPRYSIVLTMQCNPDEYPGQEITFSHL